MNQLPAAALAQQLLQVDAGDPLRLLRGIIGIDSEAGPTEVAILADENPEIAHLELNPVSTHPGGLDVLGARITLAPASLRQDSGRRAMT